MAHFVKYRPHNAKEGSPSISHTIQTIDVGKTFQFGVYGASGLKVGPNDASYGVANPRLALPHSTNDITWFDLVALRAGNVIVEVRNPVDNAVWDYFQLEVTANYLFYIYFGRFDMTKFEDNMKSEFAADPKFDTEKLGNARTLATLMQSDPLIIDIRWMAYMLATVYWETTYPRFKEVAVVDKKTKKPVLGPDGQPLMKKILVSWKMTMDPVDEFGFGKGRSYHMPVKVMRLPDGSARITENDGDQFTVSLEGKVVGITKHAKMGAPDGATSEKIYTDDTGTPLSYFGRGYVQLTWWANYATAGAAIGRALELLFDPELVKLPAIAYALMSHSMRTGDGFANGHRFVQYFSGNTTNYRGARAMVNGSDHDVDIANYAKKFETILLKSKETAP